MRLPVKFKGQTKAFTEFTRQVPQVRITDLANPWQFHIHLPVTE